MPATRRAPWVWAVPLAVAAAVAVAVVVVLVQRGGDDEAAATTAARTATVPSIVGRALPDGFQLLNSAGYQAQIEEEPSVRPAQEILRQEPEAGSELERGELVFVTVSSGKPPPPRSETRRDALPDVTGRMHTEAGAELERLGFPTDSYPVPSDEPLGTVVGQDPDPGLELPVGEPVRLTVSRGRSAPAGVNVPHVEGVSARVARSRIRAAKLTVRTVERDAPTRQDVGKVILQEPNGGDAVLGYSQMTIYVGR